MLLTSAPLVPSQADASRNALCKMLYASLFDWLVARINEVSTCNRV